MKNSVLTKFQNHEKSIGTFASLNSPIAAGCLSYTGLDYVVIDMEHTPVDIESATTQMSVAQSRRLTALVRVNAISRTAILRPLDAGAPGVVVPCVETVEEVRQLIGWAKFAPVGRRGFCPSRDGGWGFAPYASGAIEDYMAYCNREALLLPQCETLGCLEHIEEIAAMDGVDGIFVGPYDLSIALGKPGQLDDPEVRAAIARIQRACRDSGKLSMIYTNDPASSRQRFAEGFDSATMGMDSIYYIDAYRKLVADALS